MHNDDEIQHPSGSSSWQMPATPAGRTHTHSSVDEERAQAAYQAAQAAFAGSSAARPQPHNAVPQPYHFSAEADLRGRFESHARPLSQADTMPTTTQSYGPPPTTALRGPASVAIPQLRTPTQERIRPRPKRMAQEQPPAGAARIDSTARRLQAPRVLRHHLRQWHPAERASASRPGATVPVPPADATTTKYTTDTPEVSTTGVPSATPSRRLAGRHSARPHRCWRGPLRRAPRRRPTATRPHRRPRRLPTRRRSQWRPSRRIPLWRSLWRSPRFTRRSQWRPTRRIPIRPPWRLPTRRSRRRTLWRTTTRRRRRLALRRRRPRRGRRPTSTVGTARRSTMATR